MRILVVEDDSFDRDIIRIILEDMGYIPELAENGEEAVEKVNSQNYDAIIMDMQMPVLSGIKAAKKIRNELKLDIPIIALTAADVSEDREEAIEAGIDEYLIKPVDKEKLRGILAKYISS